MNILDANIPIPEREKLRGWKVPCRRIGEELAEQHTEDADLIPLLHRLGDATFFTRDRDFWRAELCHRAYCLVYLDVPVRMTAQFIRRFLRHPAFNSRTKRLGTVVHVHAEGLSVYRDRRAKHPEAAAWIRAL